ncbi:oxidoreductase [Planctomycetales bacterium]|nr:oxidoreductase [Planctomycetales bacterium]
MLKIGIHGLGFMGMMHYLAYQRLSGVKVTAICEVLEERRKGDWTKIKGNFGPQGTMMNLSGVATYANAEEMLADGNVDMVDVCLPPNQHCDAVINALKAGKNVLSEKPIALSLENADTMIATAQQTGHLFFVGHVLPFFPAYAFVYEARQTNKYGKLLGGHFDRVISDPVWLKNFYNMETIGGPLLDLHIHDAHFIRLLFGMPQSVDSIGRLRNGVPEYFTTQYQFADPDILVTSISGCIFQQGRPFMAKYEVHFEKATLVSDGGTVTILTEDGKVEKAELPVLDEVGVFTNELKEVTDSAAANKVSPILSGDLARDTLAICLREMQSIQSKK